MNDPTLIPVLAAAVLVLILMFWRLIAGLILTASVLVFIVGVVTVVMQAHEMINGS